MKINKYSFLRWMDAAPSSEQPEIPWSYNRDRDRLFCPIAYPSEAMAFYIASPNDAGLNFSNFADLRVAVVNATTGTVANSNAGMLEQHFLDSPTNTQYNIYCTMVVPALANGIYKLRIYRNTGGAVLLESNYIEVRNDKSTLDIQSAHFRFRHDRYLFGVEYADIPDFYQQYRLPMALVDRQPEGDREVYREVSTGKQRTLQNYLSRWVKIELINLDADAHEAASVMFDHSSLTINGRAYTAKAAYKELTNPLHKVYKGEMELWDDEFSTVNRCATV